jgi:hypothetical protein
VIAGAWAVKCAMISLFFYGNTFRIALRIAPLRAFAGYLCVCKQLVVALA